MSENRTDNLKQVPDFWLMEIDKVLRQLW